VIGDTGYNARQHTIENKQMSTTQAHLVLESIDRIDAEDYEEALVTLAQAEMDGTEDEWEDIVLPF
jgi:hypothetical protein